eukprot:SAG22_NODE_18313_length_289_cov_0.821053_2_plen_25_part_01
MGAVVPMMMVVAPVVAATDLGQSCP